MSVLSIYIYYFMFVCVCGGGCIIPVIGRSNKICLGSKQFQYNFKKYVNIIKFYNTKCYNFYK